ncbi:hypothetical protein [uncultured Sphingomonas sp.]|uniref:hypothetical protein n=1 Tax=uncultured Sphingomonas sp. TaxID=158754 RepID=UPI0025E7F81F|nr:hypothetical protein [uncultured Sphingomonas sp.]
MIGRAAPLLLLLALAACNRGGVADVTLDADANQRTATAAKTLADLAAADAASRGPAPVYRPAPRPAAEAATARSAVAPAGDEDGGDQTETLNGA